MVWLQWLDISPTTLDSWMETVMVAWDAGDTRRVLKVSVLLLQRFFSSLCHHADRYGSTPHHLCNI